MIATLSLCLLVHLPSLQDKRYDEIAKEWVKAETEHYVIHGETGEKIVKEYKVVMELLFEKYAAAFKFKGELKKKAKVYIHKDRESYLSAGAGGNSVAYYSSSDKRLVSYEDPELLPYMAHEATHQFFDLAFPEFFENEDVPSWFSEGIAECFCNCRVKGRRIWVNYLDSENGWYSVKKVQEVLKEGKLMKLSKLLNMSERDFAMGDDMYPISWSFCHFLWNAPNRDNGKGVYREVIMQLIEAFKKGKSQKEAYEEAFQIRGKKINLEKLDAQWRSYINGMKARRPPRKKR